MNQKLRTYIFFLALAMSGCSDESKASIGLSGVNYTDSGISDFSVDGYHGGGIEANGGGGSFVCCVTIPRKWHSGMKVTVRWSEDDRLPESWKERVVDVPQFTKNDIGDFVVHFFPDDTVKVLVTTKIVGHPDYPYPRAK